MVSGIVFLLTLVVLLKTICGGSSKIWAGTNGGTAKELSLAGHTHSNYALTRHTHSVSDITGSITANAWTFIKTVTVSAESDGTAGMFTTLVHTMAPGSYIAYLFRVKPRYSQVTSKHHCGMSIGIPDSSFSFNSWLVFRYPSTSYLLRMYIYGQTRRSITSTDNTIYGDVSTESASIYLFMHHTGGAGTPKVTATISIYGMNSPL